MSALWDDDSHSVHMVGLRNTLMSIVWMMESADLKILSIVDEAGVHDLKRRELIKYVLKLRKYVIKQNEKIAYQKGKIAHLVSSPEEERSL